MSPEELLRHRQRSPFVAFRVHLSGGQFYDVRHPEMLLLAQRTAEGGLPSDADLPIADRIVTISLIHIVGVEPLPAGKPTSGNGSGT
jgi:hypothetical protein